MKLLGLLFVAAGLIGVTAALVWRDMDVDDAESPDELLTKLREKGTL